MTLTQAVLLVYDVAGSGELVYQVGARWGRDGRYRSFSDEGEDPQGSTERRRAVSGPVALRLAGTR